eukprot:scaffold262_cov230-Pinguiococcus_pyrenoidosus.AAC.12
MSPTTATMMVISKSDRPPLSSLPGSESTVSIIEGAGEGGADVAGIARKSVACEHAHERLVWSRPTAHNNCYIVAAIASLAGDGADVLREGRLKLDRLACLHPPPRPGTPVDDGRRGELPDSVHTLPGRQEAKARTGEVSHDAGELASDRRQSNGIESLLEGNEQQRGAVVVQEGVERPNGVFAHPRKLVDEHRGHHSVVRAEDVLRDRDDVDPSPRSPASIHPGVELELPAIQGHRHARLVHHVLERVSDRKVLLRIGPKVRRPRERRVQGDSTVRDGEHLSTSRRMIHFENDAGRSAETARAEGERVRLTSGEGAGRKVHDEEEVLLLEERDIRDFDLPPVRARDVPQGQDRTRHTRRLKRNRSAQLKKSIQAAQPASHNAGGNLDHRYGDEGKRLIQNLDRDRGRGGGPIRHRV